MLRSVSAEKSEGCQNIWRLTHPNDDTTVNSRALAYAKFSSSRYMLLPKWLVSVNGLALSETMQSSEVKKAALVQNFTKDSKVLIV